jgi:ankyrin repeat protein
MALTPGGDDEGRTLLWTPSSPHDQAAMVKELFKTRGGADVIEQAVEKGMLDPNLKMNPGNLIHCAATFGPVSLLRYLIFKRGVDPNQQAGDGQINPLTLAICASNEPACLFLINDVPGVDLEARSSDGNTPLMTAAGEGMVKVMKALVAKGVDVEASNDADGFRTTAVVHAIGANQEEAALYLLEEANASWDLGNGRTAASIAAMFGCLPVLKFSIRQMRAEGLDEAAMAQHMGMAAVCAIGDGKVAALKALVEEEGLNASGALDCGPSHSTLLHAACGSGDHEIVAYLLKRGADPLARDSKGILPHHNAASKGHLPVLRLLFDRCPALHVNTPAMGPQMGITALHTAAMNGHLDNVQWLIAAGADPLRVGRCNDGIERRASTLAERIGHATVAVFLKEQETIAEEAAARRARNEKRRQKQKRAKARRQQE